MVLLKQQTQIKIANIRARSATKPAMDPESKSVWMAKGAVLTTFGLNASGGRYFEYDSESLFGIIGRMVYLWHNKRVNL